MPRSTTVTGGRAATTGVIRGRFALSVGRPDTEPPSGFRWVGLSEVARLESGHTPSRQAPQYWGGDVPWIGIRDATENHGRILASTHENVTELGIANSSARILPAGTVCLSRTASVGYVVMMATPMATSQDFVNWVCGPELVPRYLMYVLMAEQASIRRFAHGTTHQTMYYPEAKALHICLPDKRRQGAIAEILGALDDKIAANRRTTDLLTAELSATWRQYFADEEHDVWLSVPIGQLATVVGGTTPRTNDASFWDGDIAWATPKDLSRLSSVALLDTGRHITRRGLEQISSGL
ncbi:MAG TPA: hypothetical protein DCX12_03020, partial [Chloroflexi bacterium]|nr:hypothetical protein [Chloroflexota bacterium]